MAGGFTLGVAEPRVGARATTLLTMHATIHIEDIKTFTDLADIAEVQEWLGHANIMTTRIYDHYKTRPE
ncbi:MAG: hypothetical protein ACREUR_11245 [Nitrosospira sp.]